MSIEINKICRTCLALEGALLSIYESKGSSGSSGCVADMLGELTNNPPKRFDGLPERVCLACISEINRCYSFKIKCDNSERTLRQLVTIEDPEVEEEEIKLKPEINDQPRHSDEKKKAQKRKADTGEKILPHETEQEEVERQSNEIYAVQTEGELEASYFVIRSNDEESEGNEGKHVVQNEAQSDDFGEILNKFVNQPQNNEEEGAYDVVETEEYKAIVKRAVTRKKEELRCMLCPMTFVHPRNLTKHMLKHHNVQDSPREQHLQFPIAIKTDKSEQDPKDDTQEEYEIEFQSIEEAEESGAVQEPQIMKQLEEVNMHKHRCPRCGAGFAQSRSLNIHIKQNKCTEKQYSCEKCCKVFVSQENLKTHMRSHQEETCSDCGLRFSEKEELNEHRAETHNLKFKNQCPNCKKVFTMLSTLKDHMRIHSGERPFLCSLCGKGFSQNANLKQHIMRHNKTKPFKCEECSRSFVSKGELFSHFRRHTGDHPFVCDICKTAFTTSSSLVKHKRIHTGERPYACEFCPMRFTALNTLKNHRRTHTGEKPYKCKFCQRGFAQKSDCAIHMRTHTGERRYICQICGSAFQQSGTLRTHMKTHKSVKVEKGDTEPDQEHDSSVNAEMMEEDQHNVDGEASSQEDQQQRNSRSIDKKPTTSIVGVELGDDDILHFAIEECSSENNDFSGE